MRGKVSFYGDYLKERTDDCILEDSYGFATYRFLNEGKSVYIVDIYTTPEMRKTGHAAKLADQIADEARKEGCTEMLGTVNPSTKGSTASLKVLLAYGMTLVSSQENVIVMRKDL